MKGLERIRTPFNKYLYFSVFAANLATFTAGIFYTWSSPAIPRLNGSIEPENNPLETPITSSEEPWIASLLPLGSFFSAFISGFICDKIGRKRTILISAVPSIIGLALCAFPKNVYYFFFGRFISGLACGIILTAVPIYVGEISEKHNRGLLSCIFTLSLTLGNLLMFSLAPCLRITTLCAMALVGPALFIIVFGRFAPESPYYFIMKNEIEQAKMALLKLRYSDAQIVETELPVVRKNIEEAFSKKRGICDFFKNKGLSRGLMIALTLAAFQQLSGVNIVFFYMQSIFEESKTVLSSDLCTIIVAIVQCTVSLVASITIDKFGRKVLLLTSAIGMMVTLGVLSVYFYMKENSFNIQSLGILPILFINLFVVAYTFGFGPVVFGIAGELFPIYAKSMATTLTVCCHLTSLFIVTSIFPYLKEAIGIGFTFAGLAIICLIAASFVYFKVPETKGKSLQEIEEMLGK